MPPARVEDSRAGSGRRGRAVNGVGSAVSSTSKEGGPPVYTIAHWGSKTTEVFAKRDEGKE